MLVSHIERIGSIDPLAALEKMSERALVDDRIATHIAQGRAYWTRPRDHFAIAGFGAVATFDPAGQGRFASVSESWSALLKDAVVDGPDTMPGVGPILMGGFAFDPDRSESRTWSGFSASHLILPRVVITSIGGESFITINVLMNDGSADVDPETLQHLREAVVSPVSVFARDGNTVPADLEITELSSEAAWLDTISAAVKAIRADQMEKVVIARAEVASAAQEYDVFALLRYLQSAHLDSLVFGYWRGERAFVGASPERLVLVDGRNVEASSLAGTIKRGITATEDSDNARALESSAKDRAEHAAVRNALYDALAEECESVDAPTEPSLLTLPHVHHLHTQLRGRLREGRTILDVVERLHPTPAVGGSPRDAALDFIRDHEDLDRGWYAGPIGWIGRNGGELAVALRSALIDGRDATLFAGCGIVADSDPSLEYAESSLKLKLMESALAACATVETDELTVMAERTS